MMHFTIDQNRPTRILTGLISFYSFHVFLSVGRISLEYLSCNTGTRS
jgi:hypothetical protein